MEVPRGVSHDESCTLKFSDIVATGVSLNPELLPISGGNGHSDNKINAFSTAHTFVLRAAISPNVNRGTQTPTANTMVEDSPQTDALSGIRWFPPFSERKSGSELETIKESCGNDGDLETEAEADGNNFISAVEYMDQDLDSCVEVQPLSEMQLANQKAWDDLTKANVQLQDKCSKFQVEAALAQLKAKKQEEAYSDLLDKYQRIHETTMHTRSHIKYEPCENEIVSQRIIKVLEGQLEEANKRADTSEFMAKKLEEQLHYQDEQIRKFEAEVKSLTIEASEIGNKFCDQFVQVKHLEYVNHDKTTEVGYLIQRIDELEHELRDQEELRAKMDSELIFYKVNRDMMQCDAQTGLVKLMDTEMKLQASEKKHDAALKMIQGLDTALGELLKSSTHDKQYTEEKSTHEILKLEAELSHQKLFIDETNQGQADRFKQYLSRHIRKLNEVIIKQEADIARHEKNTRNIFHELAVLQITIRHNLGLEALRLIRKYTTEELADLSTKSGREVEAIYDTHLHAISQNEELDVHDSSQARLAEFVTKMTDPEADRGRRPMATKLTHESKDRAGNKNGSRNQKSNDAQLCGLEDDVDLELDGGEECDYEGDHKDNKSSRWRESQPQQEDQEGIYEDGDNSDSDSDDDDKYSDIIHCSCGDDMCDGDFEHLDDEESDVNLQHDNYEEGYVFGDDDVYTGFGLTKSVWSIRSGGDRDSSSDEGGGKGGGEGGGQRSRSGSFISVGRDPSMPKEEELLGRLGIGAVDLGRWWI